MSIIFSALLSLLIFGSTPVSATVLFQDDFSDPDINSILTRWEVPRNSCGTNWVLSSGRIGININSSACQTEFTPKDSVWGNWNDYVYEVDMILPPNSGTDKNTAFRYSGPPNFYWYGIHFQVGSNDSNVVLERVCWVAPCPNNANIARYPVTNGNSYHLKTIVSGNHIQFYVDGNLIIDYPNAERNYNTGKIALRAGVGGDPHTEVYFDNVVVSSIDAPIEPVVIIPGMMGSWCKEAIISGGLCPHEWTALPKPLNPYASLIASLNQASDIGSANTYVWYYDWRKPIATLSAQLSSYIDNTVLSGRPAGTKVKIVGHSYGGLVGTQYAENNPTKVSKLITAGSPHKGVVQSYGAWEGGALWEFSAWEKLALQLLLASRKSSFPSVKDAVRNEIPSLRDILPTFDYLVDGANNTISESSLRQRNTQLPNQYVGLSTISSFLTTITGLESAPSDTLSSIKVKSQDWMSQALGLWEDGVPDQLRYSPDGDLTVLRTSGQFDAAANKPEVATTHVGLISETSGIQAILTALGSSGSPTIADPVLDDSKNYALLFLHSPATMTINWNGQTSPDTDGLVVLQDVNPSDATVTLSGTGNGAYHLDVIQSTPDSDTETTYSDTISSGQAKTLLMHIDPSGANQNPLKDTQGNLYLAFAGGKLGEMSTTLMGTGQNRSTRLLRSVVDQIKSMVNRAVVQINSPLIAARTTEPTLLFIHRLREQIDLLELQKQLNGTVAQQLRTLSYDALEQLQSAYSVLAGRAGLTYPGNSFSSSQSLLGRLTTQIDTQASTATKGLVQGALAAQTSRDEKSAADTVAISNPPLAYINYLSARMYLSEAMRVLK